VGGAVALDPRDRIQPPRILDRAALVRREPPDVRVVRRRGDARGHTSHDPERHAPQDAADQLDREGKAGE
jgi:hypothetical protein